MTAAAGRGDRDGAANDADPQPGTPDQGPEPCVPEWCDPDDLPDHSTTCPNHLVDEPITKSQLVEICHSAAEHAIDAYRTAMDPEYGFEMTADEAAEMALDEVDEGTTCYVGIGSCGRGWCKH